MTSLVAAVLASNDQYAPVDEFKLVGFHFSIFGLDVGWQPVAAVLVVAILLVAWRVRRRIRRGGDARRPTFRKPGSD